MTTEFTGRPAWKGVARGPARVCHTLIDILRITAGDILVCDMTTPEWTPAFKHVAGLATQQGGILCHAAIVAREYNLPAVVAVKGLMQGINDGDIIEINGDASTVRIIERASA